MKFNTIHSLGSRCQNSDILKHYNYREFSGFFDFMNTLKIKNVLHILKDEFNEILKPENNFSLLCNHLTIDPETRKPLPSSTRTSNKFYDTDHTDVHAAIFPHHDLNTDKDLNHFVKCKNRFKNLTNYNTLFNYTFNTWENPVTQSEMDEMVDTLQTVYDMKNFRICFISLSFGESSYKKLSESEFYDVWELFIPSGSFSGGLFNNDKDNENYINIIKSYDIADNRVTKYMIDNEF
jgi:hypothetical protein